MQNEYIDLLSLELPPLSPREETFLEIAGIQYSENTVSRLYGHFLDSGKNADVANLFLGVLLDLIKERTDGRCSFDVFESRCYLEFATRKGRIDILLTSYEVNGGGSKQEDSTAIIIENKIFHFLNNDLLDYYDSITCGQKIGVLLTPKPHVVPLEAKSCFVNITHGEWARNIKRKGLPSGLRLNDYVYINDFLNTMELLSHSDEMSADAEFFFKHTHKINRAREIYNSAFYFVTNQLQKLGDRMGVTTYGNNSFYRHIWNKKDGAQVYYAIVFSEVFTPDPTITVFLEVYNESISRAPEFIGLLKTHGFYDKLGYDDEKNSSWAHLAHKDYKLRPQDITHLADFLFQKITEDFEEAFNLVYALAHRNRV